MAISHLSAHYLTLKQPKPLEISDMRLLINTFSNLILSLDHSEPNSNYIIAILRTLDNLSRAHLEGANLLLSQASSVDFIFNLASHDQLQVVSLALSILATLSAIDNDLLEERIQLLEPLFWYLYFQPPTNRNNKTTKQQKALSIKQNKRKN